MFGDVILNIKQITLKIIIILCLLKILLLKQLWCLQKKARKKWTHRNVLSIKHNKIFNNRIFNITKYYSSYIDKIPDHDMSILDCFITKKS